MPRLGSSISSTFGLVISALPMTTFCWLPPDIEVTSKSGLGALIERSRIASRMAFFSAPPLIWKTACEAAEAGQRQVAGDGQDLHQAFALPVLRDQGKAAPDAAGGVALANFLAVDEDLAGRVHVAAHDAFEELAAPGAHQAIDAEDLAGADRERDMIDGKAARRVAAG